VSTRFSGDFFELFEYEIEGVFTVALTLWEYLRGTRFTFLRSNKIRRADAQDIGDEASTKRERAAKRATKRGRSLTGGRKETPETRG